MCPACLGAAALTALKVAAAGGLTAYGVKKALTSHQGSSTPQPTGTTHVSADDRHS